MMNNKYLVVIDWSVKIVRFNYFDDIDVIKKKFFPDLPLEQLEVKNFANRDINFGVITMWDNKVVSVKNRSVAFYDKNYFAGKHVIGYFADPKISPTVVSGLYLDQVFNILGELIKNTPSIKSMEFSDEQ